MNVRGETIFITGGAGFIGSMLAERLIEDNEIIIYDNFLRDAISARPVFKHKNLRTIKGDILDCEFLKRSLGSPTIVVHCAAIAGVDRVIANPTQTLRINLLGTANILDLVREKRGLKRFIDFSTSEVFGQTAFRAAEGDRAVIGAVGEARWTYAISKLAGEHMAYAYYKEFGVPAVTLRPFNVYGPNQVGEGAIHAFMERAIRNEPLVVRGDGIQIRAWCYVDDFIEGVLLAMVKDEAVGESLNIGNARAVVTVYGLASAVIRACGSRSSIVFSNEHYTDVELRVPSVEKTKRILGFEAKVDLEEGLRRTYLHYKEKMKNP